MSDDWIFDSLIGFLRGPVWNVPILTFLEHKSLVFEPGEGEDNDEYKKIHEDYKNLVDFMLGSYMEDIQITPQQFSDACTKAKIKTQFQQALFEQVWAADNYEIFKRMMIQKNIELQLQALELIQQRYGTLPKALLPTEDGGEQDEDHIMAQIVRKYIAFPTEPQEQPAQKSTVKSNGTALKSTDKSKESNDHVLVIPQPQNPKQQDDHVLQNSFDHVLHQSRDTVLVAPQPPQQKNDHVLSHSFDHVLHQSRDPVQIIPKPQSLQKQNDHVQHHSFDHVLHQSRDPVEIIPKPESPQQQKDHVQHHSFDHVLHQSRDPVHIIPKPQSLQKQNDHVQHHSFDHVLHQSRDPVQVIPKPQSPQQTNDHGQHHSFEHLPYQSRDPVLVVPQPQIQQQQPKLSKMKNKKNNVTDDDKRLSGISSEFSDEKILKEVFRQSKEEHEALQNALSEEEAKIEQALANNVGVQKKLQDEKDYQEALLIEHMKHTKISNETEEVKDTEPQTSGTKHVVQAEIEHEKIDPEDLKKRTEFLRAQRDKLLKMKQVERERILAQEESKHAKERPKSASAARSAMGGRGGRQKIDPQTLEVRKALARKLMNEVVYEQS